MTLDTRDSIAPMDGEHELPFREVARGLSTPCWISDVEGSIVWVNEAWINYTGLDAHAVVEQGLESLHDPAILPEVRRRWDIAKKRQTPDEMTFPLRGRDGNFRPFLTRVVPIRDSAGVVTRWFGTNTDVSAQAEAERALRESQARLELATEAAELGVWDWDLDSDRFVYSPRARAICGLPVDSDITYNDVVRVTHPEDFPRTSAQAERAFDPAVRDTAPYRYRVVRPGGEVRWVLAHGRAIFIGNDEHARAVRYVGTLQDITERVMAQERQTLLMREVDHRAKNALAIAQALVHLTPADDPKIFKRTVEGRIASLARAHGLLAKGSWEGAELRTLIEQELRSFGFSTSDMITLDGPRYDLSASQAQSMALVLHELSANATKHGALGNAHGRLVVTWAAAEDGSLSLDWNERAPNARQVEQRPPGFGFTMIEELIVSQMGGRWTREWRPQGLNCVIALPRKRPALRANAKLN